MTLWTNYFLNYGGEFLDAKGNILTDGPEAIEATKLYQTLLTKVAASRRRRLQLDGVDGLLHARTRGDVDRRRRLGAAAGRPDRLARRRQGRLHHGAGRARRDNIRRPMATASASPAASKNKEAAYLLCQWVVSKAQGARLLQAGGGVPFRNSVLNDPEIAEGREDAEGMAAVGDRLPPRSASSACR